MEIDITVVDAVIFLRSLIVWQTYRPRLDDELMEAMCLENQKFGNQVGTDKR